MTYNNLSNRDVLGIVIENVVSEAKFVSSRKISLNPASARVDVGIGDVEENMQMDVNEELVDDSQQVIHAASSVMDLNNEDFVQVAFDEIGQYLLEGEIEKSGLIADSEEVDIGICDVEENMQIIVNEKQVDKSQQVIHETPSVMVLNNVVALVEVGDHLLEGEVEKSGLNADSEECIGFLPNNLLPSSTKGIEEETYFDGSTLGDVVEEVTRLINNCDHHEYVGVTGQEDGKNQHNMKRDMDSIERYLLNDFHSFEDASGQDSDENAPTMPQHGEMKSCTSNHQQMFASGKVYEFWLKQCNVYSRVYLYKVTVYT